MKKVCMLCAALICLLAVALIAPALCGEAAFVDYLPEGVRPYLASQYPGWTPVKGARLFENDDDVLLVLSKDGRNTLVLAQGTGGAYATAFENDAIIPDGPLMEQQLELRGGEAHFDAYIACSTNDDNDFYFEISPQPPWRVTEGSVGRGQYGTGEYAFAVTNAGTALRVWNESYYSAVYVPLALELSLESFDIADVRAFCADAMKLRNKAALIPSTQLPDALPQGKVVAFKAGQKYPVYAGPGKDYLRLGDNKNAVVSTNDWIQVFGRDGDWILIQYNIADGRNRFGYITADALPRGTVVPALSFTARQGAANRAWATDDPLGVSPEVILGDHAPCTVLATMGEEWFYIETTTKDGEKYRGFIVPEGVDLYESHAGQAIIRERGAALYQDAGLQTPIGFYHGGVEVRVLASSGGASHIRVGCDRSHIEGYVADADIAFGALPGDIAATPPFIALVAPESADNNPDGTSGYKAPDYASRRVGLRHASYTYRVLGAAGDFSHILLSYELLGDTAFVPSSWALPLPGEYIHDDDCVTIALSADTPLLVRPEADAPSVITLYKGVQVRAMPMGEHYLIAEGALSDDWLYGYVPSRAVAAPVDVPLKVGMLTPADQADARYVFNNIYGSLGFVCGWGTRCMLLGESQGKYLVKTALEGFAYFDKRDVSMTSDTVYQRDPLALRYGVAAYNGEGGVWGRPYETSWGWGSPPDGAEAWLLGNLGDWWCVTFSGYDTAFVRTENLTGLPAGVPAYDGIYNAFRDMQMMWSYHPQPLMGFAGEEAVLLLNVDGKPVMSFRAYDGGRWTETRRTGWLLGEEVRTVHDFAVAEGEMTIGCYLDDSDVELHVTFTRSPAGWLATGFAMVEVAYFDDYGMETLYDHAFALDDTGLYIPGDGRPPLPVDNAARTLEAFSAAHALALCQRYLAQ